MCREFEVLLLAGVDVDDERLHVSAGFLLGQGVILHVLAGISGIVGKTDAIIEPVLRSTDHRS